MKPKAVCRPGHCNNPPAPGDTLCATCRESVRRSNAARRERLIAAQLCRDCGQPLPDTESTRCSACRAAHRGWRGDT